MLNYDEISRRITIFMKFGSFLYKLSFPHPDYYIIKVIMPCRSKYTYIHAQRSLQLYLIGHYYYIWSQ